MSLLPYQAKYVNARGDTLLLDRPPCVMVEGTVFDSRWKLTTAERITGEGVRVLSGRRPCEEQTLTLQLTAGSPLALSDILERMSDLLSYDVISGKPGRLWINGRYLSCWCSASVKRLSCDFTSCAKVTLTVYPELPVWCKEKVYQIVPFESVESDGHNYSYSYPYKYDTGRQVIIIYNDSISASPMRITFYGPADCPYIYVGTSKLGVNVRLLDREYAVIDQVSREVYKVTANGTRENCFDLRIKNGLTFERAPSGENVVQLGSESGADIVLIEQRSEASWSCS